MSLDWRNKVEIEYIELYPNVHVYTNLMPDAQELYEIMKESEQKSYGKYFLRKWEDWSYFGTYSQKKEIDESIEFGEIYNKEKFLEDRLTESYSKALSAKGSNHKRSPGIFLGLKLVYGGSYKGKISYFVPKYLSIDTLSESETDLL